MRDMSALAELKREFAKESVDSNSGNSDEVISHAKRKNLELHAGLPSSETDLKVDNGSILTSELPERLSLKLLPNSNVSYVLSNLFTGEAQPLDALSEALTADRTHSFLIRSTNGPKESLFLSTPRYRMGFFEDRFNAQTVIVKSVEKNAFSRWESDRKRGVPCNVIWASRSMQTNSKPRSVISGSGNDRTSTAPKGFWDFWGSILAKERETLQVLLAHPGWSYSQRRAGIHGGIEFKLDEFRDEVLQKCGATFLVERDAIGVDRDKGNKHLLFDALQSESSQWIAGACRRAVDLSEIPKTGRIRVDWIGVQAELKRRHEALDRLSAGKAAQPRLAEMLPDGPSTPGSMIPFAKILPTSYNSEQVDAISKALLPGSFTSILGPPGTGKTSVIAEIAAQLASAGNRVLISAQSNLAVDNALEKVTEVESIFAVRIGRPETVKLNPELLLDRSSARYRDRLLTASIRGEERMALEVHEGVQGVPSSDQLNAWIDEWIRYKRLRAAHVNAQYADRLRRAAHARAESVLNAAESRLISLCSETGLDVSDVGSFIRVGHDLENVGVNPDVAHNKRASIDFAIKHRPAIAKLAKDSANLAGVLADKRSTDEEVRRNQEFVADWTRQLTFLAGARTANANYEREKAAAGFWKTIGLWFSGPPHDLPDLEKSLAAAGLLRAKAVILLPSLLARQDELRKEQSKSEKRCLASMQRIIDRVPTVDQIESISATLMADLELADLVRSVGAYAYLAILNRLKAIESAFDFFQESLNEAQHAKAAARMAVLTRLAAVISLGSARDPRQELAAVAKLLRVTTPATFVSNDVNLTKADIEAADANGLVMSLRERRFEVVTRAERWPAVAAALCKYRNRLNQPVTDLQRAVLSEANVIGATCSGIAGTRDFDCDFDCVIVDEAGRTTPLDLLMPIVRGKTIVLVGDHKQLPPFIGEDLKDELNDIERKLVERSIFETIWDSSHQSRRQALRNQYRMAPPICDIVRKISYFDDLETAGDALRRRHRLPGMGAVHWVLPTGPKNNAVSSNGKHGLLNYAEVEATVEILKRIAGYQSDRSGVPYSIGIISMYKQQSHAIERRVERIVQDYPTIDVEIGTVDSFQGREKDAVILTFSETNPKHKRFFYDRRRLNVALSRARELLVIIGSLDKIGSNRIAFGIENPLHELRLLIESGIGDCTKELFNA